MILIIDNYDSFTYNLVDYIGKISNIPMTVIRNDAKDITEIQEMDLDYIIISPGPKSPKEAGISKKIIPIMGEKTPILGVCLGHQCIGEVYGGKIIRAKELMHGKTSYIHHNNHPLFKNMPNPFSATRYHSLVIESSSFPNDTLDIIATSENDNEIMAIKHKKLPIYGVQFHPESIYSPEGLQLLKNFLHLEKKR
jgi:anthranilate synthase/aminodeoxychorismate synthase-like glutamine amidotransferase